MDRARFTHWLAVFYILIMTLGLLISFSYVTYHVVAATDTEEGSLLSPINLEEPSAPGPSSGPEIVFIACKSGCAYKISCASSSMYPSFTCTDMLEMVRIVTPPKPGDIIWFDKPNKSMDTIHRIVSVQGDSYTTKGDNNPEEDVYHPQLKDIKFKIIRIIKKA